MRVSRAAPRRPEVQAKSLCDCLGRRRPSLGGPGSALAKPRIHAEDNRDRPAACLMPLRRHGHRDGCAAARQPGAKPARDRMICAPAATRLVQ